VRGLNRRKLFIGTAAGLTTSYATAMTVEHADSIVERPLKRRPYDEEDAPEPHPRANPDAAPPRQTDAVAFWSDTILDLVALDHSIEAKDARAPGPCASARAVALAHIVMADAVCAAYPVDYQGLYVRERNDSASEFPDAFIGGATAWILEHIFGTPAHSQFIASQRMRFLDNREPKALPAWEAGLAFGRNEAFTSQWNRREIQDAIAKTPTTYVAPPRGHTVDPFNPDQGFYGVLWGRTRPLTPDFGNIADYGPGDPPREHDSEYRRDYLDVLERGAYRDELTPEQVRTGLFWAYDGARLIGTPARIYNRVLRQIAQNDGLSPQEMARLLALSNIAMADASIVCWGAKYHYRVWRPVVAIPQSTEWLPAGVPRTNPTEFALGSDTRVRRTAQHFMGAGEGDATPRPANRALPYKLAAFTPNFPSYPSGHASLASACFGILRRVRAERGLVDPDLINPDLVFVSDELNGLAIDHFANRPRPYVPRSFSSISKMLEDINRSRVYLGVHWNFDCVRGAASGARVAKVVYDSIYQRRATDVPPRVSELQRRRLAMQCRSSVASAEPKAFVRSR
jgi:membrane-associated phospholipid phosphatase